MKIRQSMIITALLAAATACSDESMRHGGGQEPEAVAFSLRENDFSLCGQEFWDNLYALTVQVFDIGAANVIADEYAAQVFTLVRSSKEFESSADEFIDHIKDAPEQLVMIVREDPTVLDSCANFSVALVGPP